MKTINRSGGPASEASYADRVSQRADGYRVDTLAATRELREHRETVARNRQVITMRRDGMTREAVGQRLGISPARVSSICKTHGLGDMPRGRPRKKALRLKPRLRSGEFESWIIAAIKRGMSKADIIEEFGITLHKLQEMEIIAYRPIIVHRLKAGEAAKALADCMELSYVRVLAVRQDLIEQGEVKP